MNGQTERISEFLLERFLLGELPGEEMEAMQRRVEEDSALRARLAALEQSDRVLLERYPPAWMGRRIRLRVEGPAAAGERRWRGFRRWAVPAVLAGLLAVAVVPGLFDPEVRIKGLEPHLKLFRKTDAESELLTDGARGHKGDFVQIVYLAAGEKYGVILSLDGRGTTTLHLPATGKHAVELRQDGPDTLAYSYELDDAPQWERFYFVTADIPFDLAVVRKAVFQALDAGDGAKLELPPGFKQYVFTLKKDGGS